MRSDDEEDFEGMEDYDEGRSPEPSDEDALDWGEDYRGCGIPGCDCADPRYDDNYDDED